MRSKTEFVLCPRNNSINAWGDYDNLGRTSTQLSLGGPTDVYYFLSSNAHPQVLPRAITKEEALSLCEITVFSTRVVKTRWQRLWDLVTGN